MPLLETCTDHVRGEGFFTITAAETWTVSYTHLTLPTILRV